MSKIVATDFIARYRIDSKDIPEDRHRFFRSRASYQNASALPAEQRSSALAQDRARAGETHGETAQTRPTRSRVALIMALFDLLGRRWAMGVLWTLSEGGAMTFRELQDRCETISPSVLNQRLGELKQAGFVTRSARGYVPTPLGERIYRHLVPLGDAARDWSDILDQSDPV